MVTLLKVSSLSKSMHCDLLNLLNIFFLPAFGSIFYFKNTKIENLLINIFIINLVLNVIFVQIIFINER